VAREIKFSLVYRDMWQSSGKYVPRVDQLVEVAPAIIDMGCFDRVETNGGAFEQVNLLFGENPNVAVRKWTAPFHKAGIQTHMLERGLNALRMNPVPKDVRDLNLCNHIKDVIAPCRFGSVTICSAEKHDQMIAFTSEMCHIVSNAYIKSPTAREHKGFSAGSYKDMTRVAWLNEEMWTEIFMENKDNILFELDTILRYLEEYKDALEKNDAVTLKNILRDGKLAKEEVDGI
jgi:hypothetical protein